MFAAFWENHDAQQLSKSSLGKQRIGSPLPFLPARTGTMVMAIVMEIVMVIVMAIMELCVKAGSFTLVAQVV